ncbi:Putative competence protein [Paucilactobacillus oligofermentans DSM 15707 = LMG 22743]|nr:Putative competence protein [Paucilactobacillus oligofermentans DSM 15707 = LMG 22743]
MKKTGYVLINVLIVMALITSYEVYRYNQCYRERRMYTNLQNKLLCDVMLNLANNQQKTIRFNTGIVNFDDEKVLVKLNNGFSLSD